LGACSGANVCILRPKRAVHMYHVFRLHGFVLWLGLSWLCCACARAKGLHATSHGREGQGQPRPLLQLWLKNDKNWAKVRGMARLNQLMCKTASFDSQHDLSDCAHRCKMVALFLQITLPLPLTWSSRRSSRSTSPSMQARATNGSGATRWTRSCHRRWPQRSRRHCSRGRAGARLGVTDRVSLAFRFWRFVFQSLAFWVC